MMNPENGFFGELKRRRVLRVVGAYLVAAFVVLQVGDLVVAPLGLPGWTMTLLIVLLALGLVPAAALAWMLERTPEGIRRDDGAGPTTQRIVSPRNPRTRLLLATSGLAAVATTAGWLALRWPTGPALDAGLVVVAPARVAGADGSVSYLREGVLDLLSAKLGGGLGLRAVDPRTTLHALAVAGDGDQTADLPLNGARAAAGGLGAGRLLLTEVVGRPDRLTVSASLVAVADGGEVGRAMVQGAETSLDSLTDALVAQVLAADQGEAAHRIPTLTASLPALREYLAGRALYRAGDMTAAVRAFERALAIDSTLAIAALGVIEAADWTFAPGREKAVRLAWAYREALSPRYRDYLDVMVGPHYPRPYENNVEALEIVSRALSRSPDRPELHYRLGDVLLHQGMSLNVSDAIERAEAELRRAVELDPRYIGPIEHLSALAARRGDTAAVRSLTDAYLRAVPPEDWNREETIELRWMAHMAGVAPPPFPPDSLGIRGSADDEFFLIYPAVVGALDPRLPLDGMTRRWQRGEGFAFGVWLLASEMGAHGLRDRARNELAGAERDIALVIGGLFQRGDPVTGDSAAARLATTLPADGSADIDEMADACLVALWGAVRGNPKLAATSVRVRGPARHPDALPLAACDDVASAVVSLAAGAPAASDAPRLLARADSLMRLSPRTLVRATHAINLILARAFEELGDPRAALDAARRAEAPYLFPHHLAAKLRTEGRLAASVGDHAGAIEAYRRYFALRPDPDPEEAALDEPIRRELTRLLGNG